MARHHALIDRKLVDVARGKLKRLIVQMPPRHGKSELCAKHFSAWYRGAFRDRKVLITSATQPLAAKWSGEARDLIGQFGEALFNVHLRADKQATTEWALEEGGEMRAAGVGGSIFGFGFHVGIIDDYFGTIEQALSVTERDKVHQWFHGTFKNRQEDEHTSAIVIIATRYHKDDLVGRLLREQEQGGDKWDVVRLPAFAEEGDPLGREKGEALWPEKWSHDHLTRERAAASASGYPWMYDALYQQEPPDIIDSEWPADYFDPERIYFDQSPPADRIACRVIAIDPSLGKTDKSDFSAIIEATRDCDGVLWIDADICRRPAPQIAKDAVQAFRRFRPDALGCETVQFQELVGHLILQEAQVYREDIPLCGIPADAEKKVRIRRLSPLLAHGKLKFRRGSPGTSLLVEQLKGFPSHKFKDGPDALEMAVRLSRHVLEGGLSS